MASNHVYSHLLLDYGMVINTNDILIGINAKKTAKNIIAANIITHVDGDLFWWLHQTTPLFLPHPLFELVQKLAQFKLIAPITCNIDILITHFAQSLPYTDAKITLLNSDDGSWSSFMAVVTFADGCTLAYSKRQSNHTAHKKRLKTTKQQLNNIFKQSFAEKHSTLFVLGDDNLCSKQVPWVKSSAINQQFGRFLTIYNNHTVNLGVNILALEENIHLTHAATAAHRQLIWQPQVAALIHHFAPFEPLMIGDSSSFLANCDNITVVSQTKNAIVQSFDFSEKKPTFMPPHAAISSQLLTQPTLITSPLPYLLQDAKQWTTAFLPTPSVVLTATQLVPLT